MSMPAELVSSDMNLNTLLHGLADAPDIAINGIATDSRLLHKGFVFLACGGCQSHGVDYAGQALASGAAAIVYDSGTANEAEISDIGSSVPVIAVAGLQRHIGLIANRWFASPSESLAVTAVTGTNGKTTVAMLLAQSMQILGRRCAYIGTLGKGIETLESSGGLTSPACAQIHGFLAEFRDDNATHAAIEVSSHALAQGRTDGVRFDSAIFTNLSRDHIDYHGDMQSYFETKAQLFAHEELQHRIINIDSEYGEQLAGQYGNDAVIVSTRTDRPVIDPGADDQPFVFARAVVSDETGSRVSVATSWGGATFKIELPGLFNVENAALVLALLLRHGITLPDATAVLGQLDAPPGRMQRVAVEAVEAAELPAVYVDFAHTPDGLEVALRALRQHCKGKLWCVFGCGGDRDNGKRPLMGEIASRLADRIVVTSDNPRTEDPAMIIADVLAGASDNAVVIADRAAAIAYAIARSDASDTILIAGKGHESVQHIGTRSIPFSDQAIALANLDIRASKGDAS
jgi:UDP-N-acetylmuramoyl-L-alanyl-D-glutamate--2,6-diaminopimelate ligase